MAGTLKKMRLTVACGYGDVGREFTPTGTVRDWLLAKKWAVIVEDHNGAEAAGGRPGKLVGKAASKVASVAKGLFSK